MSFRDSDCIQKVRSGGWGRSEAKPQCSQTGALRRRFRPGIPFLLVSKGRLIALLLVCAVARADETPTSSKTTLEPAIVASQMRPHVEFLASPRLAGRSGTDKVEARKYIVEQWKRDGLRPLFAPDADATRPANIAADEIGDFEQSVPGADDKILGHNLGAWVAGSDPKLADEFVIVSAHYDHLGIRNGHVYAGADDNASGVAMMIEVAHQIAVGKEAPRRSMVFIAFDLEEHMLWGSRWFAAHPPWPIERVKLFVTADMIGRSLGNLPMSTVFVMGSERSAELRSALESSGTSSDLEVCRLGTDIVGTRSDYGPFRDRQIPFLFFSTGEHPDYHTPQDTPDKINYDKAALIASVILKVTRRVANADQAPTWSDANTLGLDEPRVLHRITTLLLEADNRKPLTQTQKFLVMNVRNRTQKIIDANKMTVDDRAWLIRMSQLLLLSVF